MNPDSTVQVDEHPSPSAPFPSSHASLGIMTPSPQTGAHWFDEFTDNPSVHVKHEIDNDADIVQVTHEVTIEH